MNILLNGASVLMTKDMEEATCYLLWGSEEEEAGQPHMKPWEGDGANNPRSHFQTWRIKRWLGVISLDLQKGSQAWPKQTSPVMQLLF